MVGQKAVAAGLADQIGSLEGLITSINSKKEDPIVDEKKLMAEHPDLYKEIVATATADAKNQLESAVATATASATQAEQARFAAILKCEEAQGKQKAAIELAAQGLGLESAKSVLAVVPPDQPKQQSTDQQKQLNTQANLEAADKLMQNQNADVNAGTGGEHDPNKPVNSQDVLAAYGAL